ncbi:MAG: hypothetical protein M1541_13790 [Acidobacteria bacterium]|nr:hypothetical protein [Acidobacteriota bacterium]
MRSFGIVLACLTLAGCAERNVAHRTATAGPVYTNTTNRGLIPAGTALEVRTNEAIEATQAAPGRTYSAEITRPVVDANGGVIVPQGSPAQLVVTNVSTGTVRSGEIGLALQSITINGRNYLVQASTTVSGNRGLGANRRTGEMVGGGALLGTLIGAVAGGGTGAAIGAVTGAAGGAAVQVITKGKEVRVPAESVLTFRLDEPIRLQNY